MLRDDGDPNRLFFTYLFINLPMTIGFLKEVGLIRRTMTCDKCGGDMAWCVSFNTSDGFLWRCPRRVVGQRCGKNASIRTGSWFQQSNLVLVEILPISYDIVCREQTYRIRTEYSLSSRTIADWGMFCREAMLVFLEGNSVKVGGPNKTVEIDESKFGRRKYHRGHPVK
jgi:hypothetical protein